MTMPHLMNCGHSAEGWCLDCVQELYNESFAAYSEKALSTAIYPDKGNNLIYPTLGLSGESGEVAEKVKKMIRDEGGVLSDERRKALIKEAGDALWYVNAIAYELGTTLGDVAAGNIQKLSVRKKENKITGDGDDR